MRLFALLIICLQNATNIIQMTNAYYTYNAKVVVDVRGTYIVSSSR
jgi:hypothetical protein